MILFVSSYPPAFRSRSVPAGKMLCRVGFVGRAIVNSPRILPDAHLTVERGAAAIKAHSPYLKAGALRLFSVISRKKYLFVFHQNFTEISYKFHQTVRQ